MAGRSRHEGKTVAGSKPGMAADGADKSDLYCHALQTLPRTDAGVILVTGASGYIGGRLVPELVARGYKVRVMVRSYSPQDQERWPEVEIVTGDALDFESLVPALNGVHTAYYLIHSLLHGPKRFEEADLQAAANFRKAADINKVERIIYLGGLGDERTRLSKHLRSRQEVCLELMRGSAKVTVLRAAIIIGSGSASFEMIQHLVRRLPLLFLPSWAKTKCQPIAIRNVIMYLVGVLETPATAGFSYDIGGPEILSYHEMLKIFAQVLCLKRFFVPIFFSRIKIYAYMTSLVTPVPHSIVSCLLESTACTVVCQSDDIQRIVPMKLLSYREAVLRALSREEQDRIYTRWSDAYPPAHELAMKLKEMDLKTMHIKSASLITRKPASSLFESICQVGGKKGWFNMNWLWKTRGMLDRILMGVGTSRGRRQSYSLRVNDVVDFWRVEDMHQNKRLLLRAEMKLPGRAWLELSIMSNKEGIRTLVINAYYQPFGFWGNAYWYVCLPFHYFIFNDLIQQIESRSKETRTG
jgi:uncharacterized protein YbjT (DUF2867 family)